MSKNNNSKCPSHGMKMHSPAGDESRRIYVPSHHEETYYQGLFLAAALSAASGYTSAQGGSPMPPSVREALLVRNEIPLRSVSSFLALSGLSHFNLRVILHTARGTHASANDATVTRQEFYTAIRLVQFRQNGVSAAADIDTGLSRGEESNDESAPLRPAYFHTVSGRSVPLPLVSTSQDHYRRESDEGDEGAHIVRLPLRKGKGVSGTNARACQQNIAPSHQGEQENHYQHHRRAHTSFQLDLSLEDEERSPSFDDDVELRRHRAISIASQTDCDGEGTADAEERDD